MRTFAMIYKTFWSGRTGRELHKAGAETQVVALYLISSPHATYTGLYSLPMAYATHDLCMTREQVERAFNTLETLGFAKYDQTNEIVFVLNAAKYQIGEALKPSDNQIKAIRREYGIIPDDSPLKREFYDKYAGAYHLDGKQTTTQISGSPTIHGSQNPYSSYPSNTNDPDDI